MWRERGQVRTCVQKRIGDEQQSNVSRAMAKNTEKHIKESTWKGIEQICMDLTPFRTPRLLCMRVKWGKLIDLAPIQRSPLPERIFSDVAHGEQGIFFGRLERLDFAGTVFATGAVAMAFGGEDGVHKFTTAKHRAIDEMTDAAL